MRRVFSVLGGLVFLVVVAGFLALQAVPYGRDHANPPVFAEPAWDSQETRALAVRACFDCHSNQTVWPWYSNLAPMSWLVQRDVEEGRAKLNFSAWGRGEQEGDDAAETVREGKMPVSNYVILHPEAKLSSAERDALVRGLTATLGGEGEEGDGGGDGRRDDGGKTEREDDD